MPVTNRFLVNRYNFEVDWGGNNGHFTEVSGLDIYIEAIPIRNGSDKVDFEQKVPGLTRFPEVTLKRGIIKGDTDFYKWIISKKFGDMERRNITIKLFNERREPVMTWKLRNCFPVSYIGPVLSANSSALAVESLVITHEGMDIEST